MASHRVDNSRVLLEEVEAGDGGRGGGDDLVEMSLVEQSLPVLRFRYAKVLASLRGGGILASWNIAKARRYSSMVGIGASSRDFPFVEAESESPAGAGEGAGGDKGRAADVEVGEERKCSEEKDEPASESLPTGGDGCLSVEGERQECGTG